MPQPCFGVRFDFEIALLDQAARTRTIAEVLTRPCFAVLRRISARQGDRWLRHARVSSESIKSYLQDRSNEALSLDSGRAGELIASAQIQNGTYPPERPGNPALRFYAYLAFPVADVDACVVGICDLARALDVGAGFVAVEPDHSRAQEVALGGRLPRERVGLSDQRRLERRGRDWKHELVGQRIANVEWATLLGPEHLARVSVDELRASGAFARVIDVVPGRLAFLQVTHDPTDDLREVNGLEDKLVAARTALTAILMDVEDVSLD
jgi:hypothetical protein